MAKDTKHLGIMLAERLVLWWDHMPDGVIMEQEAAHEFAGIVLIARGLLDLETLRQQKEAEKIPEEGVTMEPLPETS